MDRQWRMKKKQQEVRDEMGEKGINRIEWIDSEEWKKKKEKENFRHWEMCKHWYPVHE